MTPMRIREVTACAAHPRTTIVLEDIGGEVRLTFYAERDEARRLSQEIARRGCACHPIYDFVHALLLGFDAEVTRVVLEDAKGRGIGARVCMRSGDTEMAVPCYPPDALALALRAGVPIYATPDALAHAARVSASTGGGAAEADVAAWLLHVRPADFAPEPRRPESGESR